MPVRMEAVIPCDTLEFTTLRLIRPDGSFVEEKISSVTAWYETNPNQPVKLNLTATVKQDANSNSKG